MRARATATTPRTTAGVQDPAEEVPVPVTEDAQTGDAEQAAAEYRNHGQRVSEAARDDVPNREQMSTVAHANRDQKRAASSPETPETPEVEVEDEVEDADNHSRGGNGGGNGGKGGGKGR